VDPEVGLAALRGVTDVRGAIERRALVGHQRGAGDAAEVEGGLVDGKYAKVDQTRRDQRAAASTTVSPGWAAASPTATMRSSSTRMVPGRGRCRA
jgi:hypothetical protein